MTDSFVRNGLQNKLHLNNTFESWTQKNHMQIMHVVFTA